MAGFVVLNGLSLSGVDEYGVGWKTTGINWWNSPAPATESIKRPRGHGVWVGESWLSGRTVTINGRMSAPTPELGVAAAARLATAAALTAVPMVVDDPQGLAVMVTRQGEVICTPIEATLTEWQWSLQMLAEDPRKLADPLVATTGLPSSSGGLTVPFTVPFSIAAAVVSGQISLDNPGNIAGPVQLRIDGPVTGPIVTHVNSGRSLIFASSLALGAGEFITVDMGRHEVLAQGESEASRNGWVTSRGWSAFEPGGNTWAFASTGAGAGQLTVTATPAWM